MTSNNNEMLLFLFLLAATKTASIEVVSHITTPDKIRMYWKDERGQVIGSLDKLKGVEFAMNGGMFLPDYSPVGLYIEKRKTIKRLNRGSSGNWRYSNNGVFWVSQDGRAGILPSKEFSDKGIQYATQSGPILLKDGVVQILNNTSKYIRNGVGIFHDGRVALALTKQETTLHEFAQYFKEIGCKDALYMDGLVSEAYIPSQNLTQTTGQFGVLIAVVK